MSDPASAAAVFQTRMRWMWIIVAIAAVTFMLGMALLRRCPACGSGDLGEHCDGDGAIDLSPAACNACGARLR